MQRATSKRSLRLGEQLQREIAELLSRESGDPRLEGVTVSGVRLNPGFKVAEILYTVTGGETEHAAAAQALEGARGFLRAQLGRRLQLRALPELRFKRDEYLEEMIYARPHGADSPTS